MLRLSDADYSQRLAALQAAVAAAGLDRFVVSSFDSIYYLTGAGFEPLERPFFLVAAPAGQPVLLVPKLDAEHMAKARGVGEVRSYREYPAPAGHGWPDRLSELLAGAGSVGVEPTLRLEIADHLRDRAARCVPLVETLRRVKSPTEVALIRRAAGYADLAVRELLSASPAGATVLGGFARTGVVAKRIMDEVSDWDPLTTKVLMATWAAPRSAQPHSIPDLKADRLGDGPHVALALLRVNGYAAECERTFFTASPTPEMRRAFAAMREARRRAFEMIRPGVACGDLDAAVGEFLRAEGYAGDDCRLHRTGHGIGLGNHEAPWLAEGSGDVLAEGMVVSVEPGVYLPGEGGYRHSDTVLVTRDGCEVLTRLPDDLDALTLGG